ncbi:MAG: carbon-nitrogen hydrolase family protein [Nocardioides sp.]
MTETLTVALVQRASCLDRAANRSALAAGTPDGADLVVFPEAFQRDFGEQGSDLASHGEAADGPFGTALAEVATAHATTVVAGMFETSPDPARPWNTLLARGAVDAAYRKIHLYDSFGYRESDRVRAGDPEPVVIEIGGFRVGLMTCYDLRFPELGRLLVDAGAEVLVVPAAWVAGPRKLDHWHTLVCSRALENTAYVVAVGQPGPRYTGHSMVVDPLGAVLAEAGSDEETLLVTFTRAGLVEARRTNPSLLNRRL